MTTRNEIDQKEENYKRICKENERKMENGKRYEKIKKVGRVKKLRVNFRSVSVLLLEKSIIKPKLFLSQALDI